MQTFSFYVVANPYLFWLKWLPQASSKIVCIPALNGHGVIQVRHHICIA